MREIKFRAWEFKAKRMNYGGFSIHCSGKVTKECFIGDGDLYVMQYTGLRDINGKEIYGGDIVIRAGYPWFYDGKNSYRGLVEWIYSAWQVSPICVNPEKAGICNGINQYLNQDRFNECEISDWEIVGNIYQNSELLENEN